jgi:hypothetical protein
MAKQTGVTCPPGYLPVTAGPKGVPVNPTVFQMVPAFQKAVAPVGAPAGQKTISTDTGTYTCAPTDDPMVQSQINAMNVPPANPTGGPPAGGASAATSLLSMTPAGAAIEGAKVATPLVKKALGGLLGKGQTKESIIKDLAKGSVVLKGVKFIGASDVLEDGADGAIGSLAEALQALEGRYLLTIPAEAPDKGDPDVAMAKRRLEKMAAQLAAAGIAEDRVTVVSALPGDVGKAKAPKPGDARFELVKAPKDWKP